MKHAFLKMNNASKNLLSRRQFVGLAGATTGLALLPNAHAENSPKQPFAVPAGLFSTTFGDYTITSLLDGVISLGRDYFLGDAAAIDTVFEEVGLTKGFIPAPINAFLLQSKERTILIDAGMGAISALGSGYGQMPAALRCAGVTADDIDTVILTHAHPDHVGGLLNAEGETVFKNAELIIAETEMQFWTDLGNMTQAPDNTKWIFEFSQKIASSYGDQITQVAAGKEIAGGITIEAAPGHTPGHSILRIDSGKEQLMMIADTLHSTELYTAIPDIGFGFDTDSKQAVETRIKLFEQLSAEKTLVVGSHIHFPGYGKIIKDNRIYRFVPITV